MKKTFASLHARTFCHATEDLERVKSALENVIGKAEIKISKTEGHHGNPIIVLEAVIEGNEEIDEFFSRLGAKDIEVLLSSLSSRIDEGCNLFMRIDKQTAFKGHATLGDSEDVISVRVHVRSFPARCEIATDLAKEYLTSKLAGLDAQ